jgi:cytochrome d ubiquinol oxidase subunit II
VVWRGISIEFRSHVEDRMWRGFWDGVFAFASTLAPILFGAALGNIIRGVPLDADGYFRLPLWTDFRVGPTPGVLDWYTVISGVMALLAVAHHGALFLAWKTDGAVRDRSRRAAALLAGPLAAIWIGATVATAWVAPSVYENLATRPLAWMATLLAIVGVVVAVLARIRGRDLTAFLGSCALLVGLLAATAACVFPTMLPRARMRD